jgi:tRNA G26 N,N-dimethylase Trm1
MAKEMTKQEMQQEIQLLQDQNERMKQMTEQAQRRVMDKEGEIEKLKQIVTSIMGVAYHSASLCKQAIIRHSVAVENVMNDLDTMGIQPRRNQND